MRAQHAPHTRLRPTHVPHSLGHPFLKQDSAEYEDREPDLVQPPATGENLPAPLFDAAGAPPGSYVAVNKERLVPAGRLRLRQGHLSLVCWWCQGARPSDTLPIAS
jgi:hypothetical protein